MQFKSVVALAAVAGVAFANNSTLTTATPSVTKACTFSDFTVTAATQVAQVAACPTAVGDINFSGDALAAIDLTGVKQVFGNVRVNGTQKVTDFVAPDLQLVSGELRLSDATILENVNLAQLTTVGSLVFNALPGLEQAGLTSGITSADSITIANTGLTSLEGIDVFELKVFDVNNNEAIKLIDSGLKSVTDTLSINYNSDEVDVVLDQLTLAKNVELQQIASLSLANLTSITGSLSLDSSSFDSFTFENLKNISNSLSIRQNDDLTEFEFPQLTKIGGALNVEENSKLTSFSGFPQLATIGGSVNLDGDFNNGTFPKLTRVDGGFNLTSTGELSCAAFVSLNDKSVIKGDQFYCEGASSTVSSSSSKAGNVNGSSSESSSGSESSSSSSSSSTKSSGDAPASGVKAFSVLLAFVGLGAVVY